MKLGEIQFINFKIVNSPRFFFGENISSLMRSAATDEKEFKTESCFYRVLLAKTFQRNFRTNTFQTLARRRYCFTKYRQDGDFRWGYHGCHFGSSGLSRERTVCFLSGIKGHQFQLPFQLFLTSCDYSEMFLFENRRFSQSKASVQAFWFRNSRESFSNNKISLQQSVD